jgi:CheY-like chemotaxis protein
MERPFRSSRFDKLLVECGRLLAEAGDHDRALADAAERLPGDSPEGQATMRRLSISATQLRQRAESLYSGLIGDPLYTGQAASDRPVVLVVDDSKDGLESVALFLELSGFHAIKAENGLEALIAAHLARPQIAVLDVAMPVLDGLEAAKLLKASPVTRNIRLMAYTGNWSIDDSALKDAFAAVLAKPASADEFLVAIQKLAAGDGPAAV